MLVFNAPQLPTKFLPQTDMETILASSQTTAFRLGGSDGLKIIRKFFRWYASLSKPRPRATILLSSLLGRREIAAAFKKYGLTSTVLAETSVPLRPLLVETACRLTSEERANRSLTGGGTAWTKRLVTFLIE